MWLYRELRIALWRRAMQFANWALRRNPSNTMARKLYWMSMERYCQTAAMSEAEAEAFVVSIGSAHILEHEETYDDMYG